MSNLGRYQEFTTAAKAAGGVDAYLRDIEVGAIVKAAPVLLIAGAGLGWAGRRLVEKAQKAKAALSSRSVQIEIEGNEE